MVLLGKSIRNGLIQHPKSVDLGLMFLPHWLVLSIRYNPRSRGWSWWLPHRGCKWPKNLSYLWCHMEWHGMTEICCSMAGNIYVKLPLSMDDIPHFLFLTFSVGKRNHVRNRWVLGDQGMSRMDYAPSAAKLPKMALELDWTCRDCLWLFFVLVKIFRLCPVVTSAHMSTYVGRATWLCGSSAYEMAKLDLHLLCLTGEGVTLSAPRTMLGYDLRKLVSERLPCKPAVKLAVHHVNRNLTLDRTLGEQGIGKSAMLSCTYIPTNVFTAWCHVRGLPTCERELVLEDVTQLEGAVPGDYLQNLPQSLARLNLCDSFNQSLARVTLPSSLQSLSFGREFNQSLERVTLPSSIRSLSSGDGFNQSVEQVTLPSSLRSLSFGDGFNRSLERERVTLPPSRQNLSFGFEFDQSLERVTLPSSLHSLSFGREFNQSLEWVTLPSSLQSLSFGGGFRKSL